MQSLSSGDSRSLMMMMIKTNEHRGPRDKKEQDVVQEKERRSTMAERERCVGRSGLKEREMNQRVNPRGQNKGPSSGIVGAGFVLTVNGRK